MTKRLIILLASLALVVPLLFMGCGSDGAAGANGANGTTGATGAAGPPGPVTNTNESCMVCHTTGRIADISDSNPASITHYNAAYHLPDVTVDNVIISDVGGQPTVTFHVTSGGNPVTTLDNASLRFMMADLVPAGTVPATNNLSTPQFEIWTYERVATGSVFGTLNTTGAAAGNYGYTFVKSWGAPDNTLIAPNYDNTHVQRLDIMVRKSTFNNAAAVTDFNVPAANGTATNLTYLSRQFVTVDACKKCHGPLLANAAHGSGYADTTACVLCHSGIGGLYGAEMTTDGAWFASLAHQIHAAIQNPAFESQQSGEGFEAVTYPQDVRNCVTCHTNSGKNLGAGDNTSNWKTHPTTAGCKTCHKGFPLTSHQANPVDNTNGTAHPGGTVADSTCATCHPPDGTGFGGSVSQAHDTSPFAVLHPNTMNQPEFNVTLTLSAPANGTNYVANENVLVTATLKKFSDNTAVAGTVYTSPKDNVGITGGGLASASLYFYGPRALPKPILAAQATNLFVSATDNNVKTDATGFKYQVKIPAGLTAGTYGVRVRFGDYGRVTDTNYKIESTAFKTVQIGTATVEKKVAGDACVDCHNTGTAPFHDARHAVVFSTDECNACHDYSGGHADALSNRVHSIHAANKFGDVLVIDWSEVSFPVQIDRCTICHTSSSSGSYRSIVHEISCIGCHGDDTTKGGATNHMLQNGGDFSVVVTP